MKNKKKFFAVGIVICVLFILITYYKIQIGPVNPNDNKKILVTIPKGVSTSQIGNILKDKELINNTTTFRILNKLSKTNGKLKAGNYILSKSMSAKKIVDEMVLGNVVENTIKFTIPEGFELRQIADRLASMNLIDKDKFYKLVNEGNFEYEFLNDIPKGENRLEGFLFPDTYEIHEGASENEIIMKMLDRFNDVFYEAYKNKSIDRDMTIKEIVTLASVIEREAKYDKERPIVASVFYNRIDKNMKLQSCATVQYILKDRKPKLSIKDTQIDSKYNTYLYAGLPEGPIASPGKASINAALNPADTQYLYFVVGKNGQHYFNKSYKEHLTDKNRS
ncbi:endolytic transglycosylase MltG [Anaeromicrobium sediminis]|uniref:Endolytic murein transglycosylase n=1 Tax=Anaeromicrobium sediminis TaxID=1478221 RepID=A0A267MMX9_9FIRM|nr:endolytic transglycosylase MltG [Anaeromicrobium sediminis]PAB60929.1 hypothetical protein CCE28_00410 [Anaeromicrobium sediminis]